MRMILPSRFKGLLIKPTYRGYDILRNANMVMMVFKFDLRLPGCPSLALGVQVSNDVKDLNGVITQNNHLDYLRSILIELAKEVVSDVIHIKESQVYVEDLEGFNNSIIEEVKIFHETEEVSETEQAVESSEINQDSSSKSSTRSSRRKKVE